VVTDQARATASTPATPTIPATHPLRCSCGALRGEVDVSSNVSRDVNRGICYCRDCQAYAHFLGREKEILNEQGGTDIIQTAPRRVSFTAGREHLACMRLTDEGMFRWYAGCCRTPIGNTLATDRMSFVGLVHACLRSGPVDESFGPARMRANGRSARGEPKPKDEKIFAGVARLLRMMLRERISGGWRHSPFFSPDTHRPVAAPRVLSARELAELRAVVEAASRTAPR